MYSAIFDKGIKLKMHKGDYKFVKYLKTQGIKDAISLAEAKKYKQVIIPAKTKDIIDNITDFKKETIFAYDISTIRLIEEGLDLINKGVPIPRNQELNSVCKNCPNIWLLMMKLVKTKDTVMLLKIPNELVNSEDIYYHDGLELRIKPEFNCGLAFFERNNRLVIETSFFHMAEEQEKALRLVK